MTVLLQLLVCQIIHCPTLDYWVTVEVSFDEEVRIFDSLLTKQSYEFKEQIASIINTKNSKIDFILEKTQQQKNSRDCGIFAIGFATDLCYRINPVGCKYSDGQLLRKHFFNYLQEGCISPFLSQSAAKRKPVIETVNIYCSC